jgi:hypothetical protein
LINRHWRGATLRHAQDGGGKHMKALVLAVGALLLMAATAFAGPHYAAARWRTDAKICQYYGFPPHTHAFSACTLNVRHYWSTGPCADWNFASIHKRYCNIIPDADF